MFDVCTKGDTAHIDMIFKFLPHTCQLEMFEVCTKDDTAHIDTIFKFLLQVIHFTNSIDYEKM